uniref:Ephrin-A1 n=1 Tax=Marmota marmota marmota TaxID=9994 RepID=A0A8C5ZPH4_MARMA
MEFLWAPVLGLCCSLAAADRYTVFWNSSNPKFQDEDYTVHVQLNDYVDIICPHYEDDSVAEAAMERYTLYLVEHQEYGICQPQPKDRIRWRCDQPKAKHGPEKLSEKIQPFTSLPLSQEFKEGHNYYYFSHSPQAHANPQEKRLPADDPEVRVLHSIGHSAAPRLFPLAWTVLLLPLLLLQTQ